MRHPRWYIQTVTGKPNKNRAIADACRYLFAPLTVYMYSAVNYTPEAQTMVQLLRHEPKSNSGEDGNIVFAFTCT